MENSTQAILYSLLSRKTHTFFMKCQHCWWHSHIFYAIKRYPICILKKVRVKISKKPRSIKFYKKPLFFVANSIKNIDKLYDYSRILRKKYVFLKSEHTWWYSHIFYAITRWLSCILQKVRVKNSKKPASIKFYKKPLHWGHFYKQIQQKVGRIL